MALWQRSLRPLDNNEGQPGHPPDVSSLASESQDQISQADIVYGCLVEEFREKTWDSFTNWLNSSNSLDWIKGKPGAGKSTLMKFLYQDPRTKEYLLEHAPAGLIILSHFFYLGGHKMQKSIKGLYCSLICQLIR